MSDRDKFVRRLNVVMFAMLTLISAWFRNPLAVGGWLCALTIQIPIALQTFDEGRGTRESR